MDQVNLESLKELYATSKEQVVIVDTQWHTLWSNREKEITQIREETGFPENIWENTERPVMLDAGKVQHPRALEPLGEPGPGFKAGLDEVLPGDHGPPHDPVIILQPLPEEGLVLLPVGPVQLARGVRLRQQGRRTCRTAAGSFSFWTSPGPECWAAYAATSCS